MQEADKRASFNAKLQGFTLTRATKTYLCTLDSLAIQLICQCNFSKKHTFTGKLLFSIHNRLTFNHYS